MRVTCPTCGAFYDDAVCWTICPHGPLWAAPDAYCKKHDLINCSICEMENKRVDEAASVATARERDRTTKG